MTHEQLLTHGEFLRRVARGLVSDGPEADDLVQSTWLSAMEARPGKVRSTRAWLKTIALNAVRGERRREEIKARCMLPSRGTAPDPADMYLREQTTRHLIDAVFGLPEAERQVVVMRFFDGLKPGEIARRLTIPRETVRTRLRRALQRLRSRLDAEHGGSRAAWIVALAPLAGLRTDTGAAAASVITPAVALSVGSAKVATLIAVSVVVVAALWFFNQDEARDIEADPDTGVAKEEGVRQPSRATPDRPPFEAGSPAEAEETKPDTVPAGAEDDADQHEDIVCTVLGRAIDERGDPVPGARIELCSTNGPTKRIAESYSDEEGYFRFDGKVVPPQEKGGRFGTVIVFGTAPGFGFAWHGMRMMNRGRRPADRKRDEDDSFYRGEECVMNLVFRASQDVEGVVVDENGAPVPDVAVSLASCDFIDRSGKHTHVNFREFWGIGYLPEHRRKTKTDDRGRFRIAGLPREMLLLFWLRHPERATRAAMVVTTDRDPATLDLKPNIVGPKGAVIERSPIEVVMPTTRRVTVRCVHPSSEAPIAGARVQAYRRGADRQSSSGRTNTQGELVLNLPVGRFKMCIDPGGDTELIRTYHEIEIAAEPRHQEITVKLDAAAIVVFEAIDAVTRKPIAGVSFASSDEDGTRGIQSNLSIVDHPKTDADGRMRALMRPGPVRVSIGWSPTPGYERTLEPRELELRAGETRTVRFELTPEGR